MGVDITYMGTKRDLAPVVADIVSQCQQGPILDAFSGMCSVAEAVGTKRQIWTNDALAFPAAVGKAMFTSQSEPYQASFLLPLIFPEYSRRFDALESRFHRSLDAERAMLSASSYEDFSRLHTRLRRVHQVECNAGAAGRNSFFSTHYANNYFGVRQAISLDALRCTFSLLNERGHLPDEQQTWCVLALGRAALRVANSTGHFAQYLKPKPTSYLKHIRQRARDVWREWIEGSASLAPVGFASWRRRNRAFNEDSLHLASRLKRFETRPAIVYADPPYSKDQYSRFYHIFDTLFLNDCPRLTGQGLYRPNRFATPFSMKGQVGGALDLFCQRVAHSGADLILSYPTNGLLYDTGVTPAQLLRKHFSRVQRAYKSRREHSTFGASNGAVRTAVTEVIYLARA